MSPTNHINGTSNVNCCKFFQTEQPSTINYYDFFTPLTKARIPSYLKVAGQKMAKVKIPKTYKFSVGNPNPKCFPYADISVRLKTDDSFKITGKQLDDALSYMNAEGHAPLIDLLKKYQDQFHGRQDWNKKELTTISGNLSGIQQVVEMFISPGDPIILQSPLYTGMIANLMHLNLEFIEVESDPDYGISPQHLANVLFERQKKKLSMPKLFYLNPTGSNPIGEMIPTKIKKEIYEIACYFNFLILEDDPYYLLTFDDSEKTPASFLSLDIENRVIRLDSFSKIMAAGFRLGYVTAAKEIIEMLVCIISSSSMGPPISQLIVYETLKVMGPEGFMEHINFIRKFYSRNCSITVKCLEKHLNGLATWKIPESSMFIWLTLKNTDHISEDFIEKCMETGLFIVPGFAFYCTEKSSPCIRLCFSIVEEDDIEKGIEILARMIKDELLLKIKCNSITKVL